jgi:hypothetical protein
MAAAFDIGGVGANLLRLGRVRQSRGTSVAFQSSMRITVLVGLALLLVTAAYAQPQLNQCAECHLTSPRASGLGHAMDWDLSAHKRAGIGCERCHGGNPAAPRVLQAHFGVRNLESASSPLNHKNVSEMCGQCHAGPYAAFQKSRHFALLKAGDTKGPTCVTCHGEATAQLLSPDAVAGECNQCHGTGKRQPVPQRAGDVRRLLERVRDPRGRLNAAKLMIDAVGDTARQQRLRQAYHQAEAPMTAAIVNGHSFVFTDTDARLDEARQRITALYQSILGASPR